MSGIKPGDRVRFINAVAPAPAPIGTIGTVLEAGNLGVHYGPFDDRSDILLVSMEFGEYEFAPEEVEVVL